MQQEKIIEDALKITSILSSHLANAECSHCKQLFKEVTEG